MALGYGGSKSNTFKSGFSPQNGLKLAGEIWGKEAWGNGLKRARDRHFTRDTSFWPVLSSSRLSRRWLILCVLLVLGLPVEEAVIDTVCIHRSFLVPSLPIPLSESV